MTRDVTINIAVKKAARLTGLGKPVLLARFKGPTTFTNYSEPDAVAEVFGKDSVAHKMATALLKQGETSPAVMAIITYDPAPEPPAVAVSAAEALQERFDDDFYFITADTQVVEEVKAIATVVEGEGIKIFGTTVTTQEALDELEFLKFTRTFAPYHETPGEYVAEALIGAAGSLDAGSQTYKFKNLVGITPQLFTRAKSSEIHAKNSFIFEPNAGDNNTSEGTTLSGDFIDEVQSRDWLIINGAQAIQEVLNNSPKVPYTDRGFVILGDALRNVLNAGYSQGMISDTDGIPDYTITTIARADTNPADRAAREYKGLSFSFGFAGAIHKVRVSGEMII